jgi:hypothetical protein
MKLTWLKYIFIDFASFFFQDGTVQQSNLKSDLKTEKSEDYYEKSEMKTPEKRTPSSEEHVSTKMTTMEQLSLDSSSSILSNVQQQEQQPISSSIAPFKRLKSIVEDSELPQYQELSDFLPIIHNIPDISIGDMFMFIEFLLIFGTILQIDLPSDIGKPF